MAGAKRTPPASKVTRAEEPAPAPSQAAVVDPAPMQTVPGGPGPLLEQTPPNTPAAHVTSIIGGTKRVQVIRNEQSVSVAGAHYTLRAGDIMDLELTVADGLIEQRLVKEI